MKRLSKQQEKLFHELVAEVQKQEEAVHEAYLELDHACSEYNGAAEQMNELLREVRDDIEQYINDRSLKWQDTDAAGQYRVWLEAWGDEQELEDIEAEEPVMAPSAEQLAELPLEPDLS